ncbi:SDR family oxidoreductase [Dyadobacter sp. CY399]|uniref:SDR family oxidoreductase n=1 Tax=Dyadobacter fanqingshengii TaxID=2906443 RepID=A0A9X1T889_9BACT|nr:SDR family oxidoreductase [Dyadobacter fanqingshengii]USJ34478.1 SDR family oxidoreductase [Dyadobacter fanqingshengii]
MFVANTPHGRRGRPEDIAKASVFLDSDDAVWITGERISVSGGDVRVLNEIASAAKA